MLNQNSKLVLGRRRQPVLALALVMIFSMGWGGIASANPDYEQAMVDAGSWLLPFQLESGAFPFSESDPSVFPNVQSAPGLGMLTAYQASCRQGACEQAFLNSAIANANYLMGGGFGNFSPNTGFPRIRAGDPIFFVRLSAQTGDPQYADFIQTNFWQRLADGIYGPQNNWGIEEYVEAELERRGAQAATGKVVAPWDLAMIAWAASEAGITQFNTALANGARTGLTFAADASTVIGSSGYDVVGLAGAVWVGALTGINVVPPSGPWAGVAENNLGLARFLLEFQAENGGFLQSSAAGLPPAVQNTVTQSTGYAILALDQLRFRGFCGPIDSGLNAIIFQFQEESGRISYFHPSLDLGTVPNPEQFLFTHAYPMIPFFRDRRECVTPTPVPVNDWRMLSLLVLLMLALGCAGLAWRRI